MLISHSHMPHEYMLPRWLAILRCMAGVIVIFVIVVVAGLAVVVAVAVVGVCGGKWWVEGRR